MSIHASTRALRGGSFIAFRNIKGQSPDPLILILNEIVSFKLMVPTYEADQIRINRGYRGTALSKVPVDPV